MITQITDFVDGKDPAHRTVDLAVAVIKFHIHICNSSVTYALVKIQFGIISGMINFFLTLYELTDYKFTLRLPAHKKTSNLFLYIITIF